jgi:hypothetical protein
MRKVLLDDILEEFRNQDGQGCPDNISELFGEFQGFTDMYHEDRFGYVNVSWGEWQIVIGYGDRDGSTMWDGFWSWSVQKNYDTYPDYFAGEITNGSPDFVVWTLFAQLSEQIDELGKCDTCQIFYDTSSRNLRCGNCGECAEHCSHDKGVSNA